MMLYDTGWHLCPHSLCGFMGLFLLKRIPWRTEHLLEGFDICLMSLMSLAKMICHDPRQDLTDVNFSNIKFVVKSKGASSVLTAPRIQPGGDPAILTGKAIPDLTLSFCDSAVSVVQSQPGASHCRSESVDKLNLLDDRPAAWCHIEPLLAMRRRCLWSGHDKEQGE